MIRRVLQYLKARRHAAELALQWSDAIARGCIHVGDHNRRQREISRILS